jgi:serine/threonine protein kinase
MTSVGNYNLLNKLGEGKFGEVWRAVHQETQAVYAVKKISKDRMHNGDTRYLLREVETLTSIQCPYVIKLIEPLRTKNSFYIVTEFCEGGDLEKLISRRGAVNEVIAKKWFKQLLEAIACFNQLEIVHRDLKLANILLTHADCNQADIKISDFGLARFIGPAPVNATCVGTPLIMAPEVLHQERYDSAIDIWSLGCVIYEIVAGRSPFNVQNMDQLKKAMFEPIKYPNTFSPLLVDILSRMIIPDPQKRLSASELLAHPYFNATINLEELSSDFNEAMHWMNLGYLIMKANLQKLQRCNDRMNNYLNSFQVDDNLRKLSSAITHNYDSLNRYMSIQVPNLNNSVSAILDHARVTALMNSKQIAAEYVRMGLTLFPNDSSLLAELDRLNS